MGNRGPKPVSPSDVYLFANDFYWSFRSLAGGTSRQYFDAARYQKLIAMAEKPTLRLSGQRAAHIRQLVEEEITAGHVKPSEKEDWLLHREEAELRARQIGRRRIASHLATKQLKVPAERKDLEDLLKATTPEQVRRICKRAYGISKIEVQPGIFEQVDVWNWPIPGGSMFPPYLSEHAEQFIAAKKDPRYPCSNRPTNELKQLWFLSRALAGAVLGIQPRTAVNLVGSTRPEQLFADSRAAKPERKRTK